jgi:hypothetical protein
VEDLLVGAKFGGILCLKAKGESILASSSILQLQGQFQQS